jgi:hypothetical protein
MPNDRPRLPLPPVGVLVVFLALVLLAGCSPPTGSVSGTVLFGNKPLPGGMITFEPKSGQGGNGATSFIDEQGHYQVTLPVGEYVIAVDNTELEARGRKAAPPATVPPGIKVPAPAKGPASSDAIKESGASPLTGMTGKYVAIPSKYQRTDTSGLSYTVTAGSQSHDVELK